MNWDNVFSREAFGADWEAVARTSAFVFSYAGVTKIAAVGGEIKDPENIPNGILLSSLSMLFSMLS